MDGSKCLVFGLRQDFLLEEVTEVIQDFLITRKELWENVTGGDFFSSHPRKNKNWGAIEKKRIDGKDIKQWDASLCIIWLDEFKWRRIIPNHNIGNVETSALHVLREFRNKIKHRLRTERDEATEADFSEDCIKVKEALTNLGLQDKADEVIKRVSVAKFGDDIPWEYETVSILGSGSFGIVLKAKHELDGQLYAVKVVPYREIDPDKQAIEKEKMKIEAKILATLNDANVVSYKHSGEFCFTVEQLESVVLWDLDDEKIAEHTIGLLSNCFRRAKKSHTKKIDCLFIKMELCGKNLRAWTQTECSSRTCTNLDFRYSISNQLIQGLNYIHGQNIVHRDLRPDNIFFHNISSETFPDKIKLGDFGLSSQVHGYDSLTMTKHSGINSLYRAPEMDKPHKDGAKYGKGVDLFALGLILSEIFDPEKLENLQKKFNEIIYLRNTGDSVKSMPGLDALILRLTNADDTRRFFRNTKGDDILPISLIVRSMNNTFLGEKRNQSQMNQFQIGERNLGNLLTQTTSFGPIQTSVLEFTEGKALVTIQETTRASGRHKWIIDVLYAGRKAHTVHIGDPGSAILSLLEEVGAK